MIVSPTQTPPTLTLSDWTWEDLQLIEKNPHHLTVLPEVWQQVEAGRAFLDQKITGSDALFYGINTGFGYLQNVPIHNGQIKALQYNLLQSHACGLGEPIPIEVVRWILCLKIKSLAQGHSGIQTATLARLLDFYRLDVLPVVMSQGSLGASGDLAPLAHLSLPLIGLGELWQDGQRVPASRVLADFGWEPISLGAKEGLALINGTQFMSAFAVHLLLESERLMNWANLIAAVSCDAFDARTEPFHPAIHRIRPHAGQVAVADTIRRLRSESPLAQQPKAHVQDPYSFRCIPQVHGASLDTMRHVQSVVLTEVNAVTDNPNLFPEEDLILSGGNFHGQPLAFGLDFLAIALAELGNISERRTYQLLSGQRGLPLFLVNSPGLHSGFMIPQYTAAGIVSENKQLCTPASVDSIVSSNGQEDHVSMGANAATKCLRVLRNLEKVLAIEWMSACQALDFRRPLRTAPQMEALYEAFRAVVPFCETDRVLYLDLEAAIQFLRETRADF